MVWINGGCDVLYLYFYCKGFFIFLYNLVSSTTNWNLRETSWKNQIKLEAKLVKTKKIWCPKKLLPFENIFRTPWTSLRIIHFNIQAPSLYKLPVFVIESSLLLCCFCWEISHSVVTCTDSVTQNRWFIHVQTVVRTLCGETLCWHLKNPHQCKPPLFMWNLYRLQYFPVFP